MKFSKGYFQFKIFVGICSATTVVSVVCALLFFRFQREIIDENFKDRYSSLVKIIGATLVEFEKTAEIAMKNSAKYIFWEDRTNGLLDTERLREIAKETDVTHIFIIERSGDFIRSTNEDPSLIPNFFSFCEKNSELFSGESNLKSTPILPPIPEPKPYKFLTIPNFNRSRLIHIGLRVDFLGAVLGRVTELDSTVVDVSVYSPDGTSLGKFSSERSDLGREKLKVSNVAAGLERTETGLFFNHWIDSAHPVCCQCANLGGLRDGVHKYLVRLRLTDEKRTRSLHNSLKAYGFTLFFVILIAFLFSAVISKKLVKRLTSLNKAIKNRMSESQSAYEKIQVDGSDEITDIGNNFSKLLTQIEKEREAKEQLRVDRALAESAAQVAHDIKSPLAALTAVLNETDDLPKSKGKLIANAALRIDEIANDLVSQYNASLRISAENVATLAEMIFYEKKAQFQKAKQIQFIFKAVGDVKDILVKINRAEFCRVMSNLINNSVEAIQDGSRGFVKVELVRRDSWLVILVSDNGKGIPQPILKILGEERITYEKVDKGSGSGLGLFHARKTIRSWEGQIALQSTLGKGTTVEIRLPILS